MQTCLERIENDLFENKLIFSLSLASLIFLFLSFFCPFKVFIHEIFPLSVLLIVFDEVPVNYQIACERNEKEYGSNSFCNTYSVMRFTQKCNITLSTILITEWKL